MAPRTIIDPYVVELLVAGDRVVGRVTGKELRAAALGLTDRGLSAREVAGRLGISSRTVHRARARRRATSG